MLYSVARPVRSGFDVPVSGDWVTIAVIAERGPIKLTVRTVAAEPTDAEEADQAKKGEGKTTAAEDDTSRPNGSKKFINLRLVDFGTREVSTSAGNKAAIRGDALLSMLLFEADSYSVQREGTKSEKIYKGGSGGAFESCVRLTEGTVIAILNPKIMRPMGVSAVFHTSLVLLMQMKASSDRPHRTTNVLGITPENAQSVVILGTARDLAHCSAVKKDGKPCGAWCDR